VLTLLLWTGYIGLRIWLAPPPPPVVAQNEKLAKEEPAKPVQGDAAKAAPEQPKPDAQQPPEVKPVAAAPHKRVTLGRLGGDDKLLVTFDSLGAAVERVELAGYFDVDDTSGYLGHLGLSESPAGGATVNIVGPGTPAALATPDDLALGIGLAPGDVITALDNKPISDFSAFELALAELARPEQIVKITVQRPAVAKPIVFTARLTRRPLEVVRPEKHVYPLPGGGIQALPTDPLSMLLTLETIGGKSIRPGASEIAGLPSLHKSNWQIDEQGQDFVQFSYTLNEAALAEIGVKTGSLKLVKRYELAKAGQPQDQAYHLNLRIEIHNLGSEEQLVAYQFQGPTGLPLEGWWYSSKLHPEMFKGAGARDVVWRVADRPHQLVGNPMLVSVAKDAIKKGEPPNYSLLYGDDAAPLDYVGVDTQFFAAAIVPRPVADNEPIKFRRADAVPVQDVTLIPKARLREANVSVVLVSDHAKIQSGQPLVHQYQLFFGPKDPKVLGAYGPEPYGLKPFIEFGWSIFMWPAWLLQQVLNLLYGLTHNYGIAIILLTVIVRSCMVPVSLKQAKSAAMMQQLAPEIQKIKDKHPDDPMKQHAAVQELYKKYNFNPFGGCLLVFIQLPIFIGLYRCLSVDIDLRDAPLFPGIEWCSNLAGPDKLFYWRDWTWDIISDEASGWFGPFFNVFPLITVALFLVQQKMFTPPATDEQTRMQQQMMTYMTVFMGIMFYKVPAGLCLYFITSSLWGIAERKLLPKVKPKDAGGGDGGGGVLSLLPAKPASPNGSAKASSTRKQKSRR
jgi:YidC/Oxa1 family membrane protein insertase